MSLLRLTFAYMCAGRLHLALSVLLFAVGAGTYAASLLVMHHIEARQTRDAANIDLVVGAKGSPMQLVLSSLYHLDVPNGTIPLYEAEKIASHPLVKQAIPLALGDSVHGFRIVGTEAAYAAHYGAAMSQGRMFERPMEAVLGSEVARALGVSVGSEFYGSHGLSEGGETHDHAAYRVVGVLFPTGSVLDRLVLTPLASVWQLHESHEDAPHEDHDSSHHEDDHDESARKITSLLISYRSPAAATVLPRMIGAIGSLQAASPAFETVRLFQIAGTALQALHILSWLFIASALAGVWIGLSVALKERSYDIALLRAMGAPRHKAMAQLLLEGGLIALAGTLLGLICAHLVCELLGRYYPQAQSLMLTGRLWLPGETLLVAAMLGVGLFAALIPAARAYRVQVHRILAGK